MKDPTKTKSVTTEHLQRYCLENGIPVPTNASKETLEAFITRAVLHNRQLKPDAEIGCFGFWADEDTNCLVCNYKSECAKVSLGMSAAKYKSYLLRIFNPKFSTQVKARKKKNAAREDDYLVSRDEAKRRRGLTE